MRPRILYIHTCIDNVCKKNKTWVTLGHTANLCNNVYSKLILRASLLLTSNRCLLPDLTLLSPSGHRQYLYVFYLQNTRRHIQKIEMACLLVLKTLNTFLPILLISKIISTYDFSLNVFLCKVLFEFTR